MKGKNLGVAREILRSAQNDISDRDAMLQQTQLAGTRDRLGSPFDLEFVEDFPVMPFYRVQGEEQPLADLLIGASLRNQA